MERYLLRSGHKQSADQGNTSGTEESMMAPGPSSLSAESTEPVSVAGIGPPASPAFPASPLQGRKEGDNASDPEWDITATPTSSQPYIDYRRLAIEVATRIAPDLQETLETTIQATLFKLQTDINAHIGRLTELENRVSTLEDDNNKLGSTVSTLSADILRMGDKLEDLENRSRRNNLRMVGLPESVPQKDLQHICEIDLPKTLGLSHACRVERVHRIGPDRSSSDARSDRNRNTPRQTIMKFLDYNDKQDILRAFRKRGAPLELGGAKLLLFEDFSADVARRRREFSSLCTRLYAQKIRFRLIYPATLLVNPPEGPPRSYKSVAAAEVGTLDLIHPGHRGDSPPAQGKRHRNSSGKEDAAPADLGTNLSPKDKRPPKYSGKSRNA